MAPGTRSHRSPMPVAPVPPNRSSPCPPSRSSPRPGGGLASGTPHAEPAPIPPDCSSPISPAAPAPVPGAASPRARRTRSQPPSSQPLQPHPPDCFSPRPGGGPISAPSHVDRGSEQDPLEHCQFALSARLCYNPSRIGHRGSGVPNLFGPVPCRREHCPNNPDDIELAVGDLPDILRVPEEILSGIGMPSKELHAHLE